MGQDLVCGYACACQHTYRFGTQTTSNIKPKSVQQDILKLVLPLGKQVSRGSRGG